MKSSLLILCLILCSMATLPLNKTKVEMNWKDFQELSTQKVDTVLITPKSQPPVGMIFENCDISMSLLDSTGSGKLTLTYVVLSESDWVEKVVLPRTDIPFSSVTTEEGDALIPTDSGYVLIARGRKSGGSRSLTLQWNDFASLNRGIRSFPFSFPQVTTGSLTVKLPREFTNVNCENATFIKRVTSGRSRNYYYSLPRGVRSIVHYTPPVTIEETKDTAIDTAPIIRETQITTTSESIHFISDERVLAISELQLTVNHTPITQFVVVIPRGFEILAIEGSGIKKWNLRDSVTLDVELTFELSGRYHMNITGEFKQDSLYEPDPLFIENADREKGKVAIALEGAGEAHFKSLENGTLIPRNRFISEMSPKLRKSCTANKKTTDDILLAAEFTSRDFRSTVTTRRHEPAKVTNAIVDSAEIFTALTKEYKSITTAQYFIRQRNRQFIELSLPADCELWSVLVNGTEVTPYMDREGGVKIPLQRFGFGDSHKVPLVLSFTYYENLSGKNMSVSLSTPLPNIAVNQLNWSLFYPEEWRVRESRGDFSTYHHSGFKKIPHKLTEKQKLSQYNYLQRESTNQKMNSGNKELPLMGLSPNYLLGKRILIVDEKPILNVNFIEVKTVLIRKFLSGMIVLLILIGAVIHFILRKK